MRGTANELLSGGAGRRLAPSVNCAGLQFSATANLRTLMPAFDIEGTLIPSAGAAQTSRDAAGPHASTGKSAARPASADLGVNGLTWRLIWLQASFLAVTAPLYPLLGLSIAWPSVPPFALGLGAVGGAWLYHYYWPGRRTEWIVAEALAVTFLLVSLTTLAAPAQYAAIALKRPLIDPWLAAADSKLGVHVPALAAWTGAHRVISWTFTLAYVTLPAQLIMPIFVLGLTKRDRRAFIWTPKDLPVRSTQARPHDIRP